MKKSKVKLFVQIVVVFIFSIVAAFYYYGLHLSFWPDPEYCMMTYKYHVGEKFQIKDISPMNILGFVTHYFICSAQYGFKGLRILSSIAYFIAIVLTTFLAVFSFDQKKCRLYLLPILACVAVLLNPGSTPYCGFHTHEYHVYPYDMHMNAILWSLMEVALLEMLLSVRKRIHKICIIVCMCTVGLWAASQLDLIFVVGFVGPLIVTGGIRLWRTYRKQCITLLIVGIALLTGVRVIGFFVPVIGDQFAVHFIDGYGAWGDGKTVYGNSGFRSLERIWQSISVTLTEVLALFNIELTGRSMFSVNTLLVMIRLCILGVICYFVCGVIKKDVLAVLGKKDAEKWAFSVDSILAWGIVLNILAVVLSSYGTEYCCSRYMTIVLFYGAIILCRGVHHYVMNSVGVVEVNDEKKIDQEKVRHAIFGMGVLLVLLNFNKVWQPDDFRAEYEEWFQKVAEVIEEKELGDGIAGHWDATVITACMKGRYTLYKGTFTENGLEVPQMQTPLHYFAMCPPGCGYGAFRNFNPEKIVETYGAPDKIYEAGEYVIYYYNDGVM